MNKILLMGRLTRDPEVRYSQSETPVAVTRYGIAVRRQFAKQGQPDVDFFNVVAFGKAGEFAEKYFKKGQMVAIVGHVQVGTWEDQAGAKHNSFDVVVEEQHFAESKREENTGMFETRENTTAYIPTTEDDDLPF